MNLASSKRQWPLGRGFERYYGFLGGETNQWYPDLVYDNHPVAQPALAGGGLPPHGRPHRQGDRVHPGREGDRAGQAVLPLLLPGRRARPAPRAEGVGRQVQGQVRHGLRGLPRAGVRAPEGARASSPTDAELSPINPYADTTSHDGKPWSELDRVRPWDSLSDDEKRLFARMAEVYAGFLSHADHELGRLLDYLEETGQLDNTIIVLVSDNGASGEGGPNGSVNENKFFNGVPDTIEENLKHLDELGGPRTYNHYPTGWAWAFNTPFKMWKRYANYEGGTADPLIVSWPQGIAEPRRAAPPVHPRDRHRADAARVPRRRAARRRQRLHPERRSRASASRTASTTPTRRRGSRPSSTRCSAPGRSGTRAGRPRPRCRPRRTRGATSHQQRWELFDTEDGPQRVPRPRRAAPGEAAGADRAVVGRGGQVPGAAARVPRRGRDPRHRAAAALASRATRYVYYPGGAEVPESVAPNIRNRSYTIAAEIEIETPEAGGVIFSQGSRFGGHALYLQDGRLKYVYNWLGELVQIVESDEPIPTRPRRPLRLLRARGDTMPTQGTLSLHIRDQKVGEETIMTQPGKFGLGGGGLVVGRSGAEPVTDDYRGRSALAVRRRHDQARRHRRQRRSRSSTSRRRRGRRSPASERGTAARKSWPQRLGSIPVLLVGSRARFHGSWSRPDPVRVHAPALGEAEDEQVERQDPEDRPLRGAVGLWQELGGRPDLTKSLDRVSRTLPGPPLAVQDERANGVVHRGQVPVEKLLGVVGLGGDEGALAELQHSLLRRRPVAPGADDEPAVMVGGLEPRSLERDFDGSRKPGDVVARHRGHACDDSRVALGMAVRLLDLWRHLHDLVGELGERALGGSGDEPGRPVEGTHGLGRQGCRALVAQGHEDVGLPRPQDELQRLDSLPSGQLGSNLGGVKSCAQPVERTCPSGKRRSPTRSGTPRSH